MSHQIVDNMIAWKGETPWHGLGYQVDPSMSGEEMLKVAKLDWFVQRRKLAMRDANGQGLVTDPLANFRAIVRMDTDEVFQVATERYHPLQNAEVVTFFKEYCEAGHATLETVGGLNGGRKVWALAKLNGSTTTSIDSAGKDTLTGYMLLATSHDGSLRTIGQPTSVRVVCWNTLSAAIGEKSKHQFMMKHSRKWSAEVAKEAKRVMGMAIEQIQATHEAAKVLSRTAIDEAGRREFVRQLLSGKSVVETMLDDSTQPANLSGGRGSLLDAITSNHALANDANEKDAAESRVGKAILEAMLTSPGADLLTARDTLWGAVNGVTYYVDHERGRNDDNRLAGAWFGTGDALKSQAMQVGLQMAGRS